jgi:hypothetical protein
MIRTVALAISLSAAAHCLAAQPGDFRFHKDIACGEAGMESIVGVVLDPDVYADTRDGFPDLRIFDAAGRETPFVIETATESRTHTVRAGCPALAPSLKERPEGLEIVVPLEKDSPAADGLVIVTPLTNFERRVRVFGSQDGKEWKPLVADGLVFDYSRYMDVNNREIRLPKNDCRQLKIVISGIDDTTESPLRELTRKYQGGNESERVERMTLERRPFRIDRIELWSEKTETLAQHQKQVEYPVKLGRIEQDTDEKATVVYVAARREPLTALTLETKSRNFSRPIVVQTPTKRGGQARWTDVAHGHISLLRFGQFRREALSVSFPEQRQSEYRIVIRNEDSPPVEVSGVKSRGNEYRAIFLAEKDQSYRLDYDSDNVESPRYDAAAVLAPLQSQGVRPSVGKLGKQVANTTNPEPPTASARRLLNDPLFMGGVIVVLVAVLAWALFRATRRINDIPKE